MCSVRQQLLIGRGPTRDLVRGFGCGWVGLAGLSRSLAYDFLALCFERRDETRRDGCSRLQLRPLFSNLLDPSLGQGKARHGHHGMERSFGSSVPLDPLIHYTQSQILASPTVCKKSGMSIRMGPRRSIFNGRLVRIVRKQKNLLTAR